ncbi:TonB-dependent receptor plug domain-containing protein [Avibacterium paragallinarum]|uniref:TonB-dependent receptor plug domain-containing protein n=1 Tax=Avibacterium paragallinarum TaxID=728 RepID=UPI0005586FF7
MSKLLVPMLGLSVSVILIPTYAQTQKIDTQKMQAQFSIPEIVIYADKNKSLTSVLKIDSDKMKKTPSKGNNITDYLRSSPHIRYENSDQDGFQQGEIKPENISINGSDANQTAYFVDNVNVNNDLAVEQGIFDGAMQVLPGISHTQAYFFDASMLSKVEVQDSNISASLGGFMGGSVIAKTKQYSGQDSFKLKYRTTHSSWAKMKQDDNVSQVLEKVRPEIDGSASLQPKYHKQNFSLVAEKGLTENIGAVLGISRRTSTINQYRLIGFASEAQLHQQAHTRRSDNLLFNVNWNINDNNRLELNTRYSNYREEKYSQTNINGNVSDYHSAMGATLAWVSTFNSGVLTNTLAYDHFKDSRYSSANYVEIVSVSDENYEPLYDYEKGGYGNSQLKQTNLHYSTEYAFEPFNIGAARHSISLGGIYQLTHYKFHRGENVYAKTGMATLGESEENIFWFPMGDNGSTIATTYRGNAKVHYQNIALYAEDLITRKNLEFRPGIRFERDDYLKNNNFSPRFVAKYSPWDNTGITLGLNRYYGRSFSSLKLTNEILKINRDTENIRDFMLSGKLKTPHSDELSVTFEQKYHNILAKIGYIHRKYKNRIILKQKDVNGEKIKYYTNSNPYNVDIYTLQVENSEPFKLGSTHWNASLGFDWLKTKRSDLDKDIDPNELIYLDGKLMTRHTMQQKVNANTEDWIARLGIDMAIPNWDLTWSNRIYIKAPIKGYEEIINIEYPDGISRYRTFDYGSHTQWDMSLRWRPKFAGKHSVYLQVDALNVLNQTRKIRSVSLSNNSEYSLYTPGREFWLEIGYEF